ncbi:MAG: DUF4974 domain-containing protein [Bacteroidales bacterium]|nr:DUF4974 domain-containing protein [Bacteroidales bacterium]
MNEDQIERIKSLLTKMLLSDLNDQEREELNRWRNSSVENESMFRRLTDKKYLEERYKDFREVSKTQNGIRYNFSFNFRNKWIRRIAAVLIIGAATFSLYQIISEIKENHSHNELLSDNENEIQRAVTLTVDGKTVFNLGDISENTRLAGLDLKLESGVLRYAYEKESPVTEHGTVSIHEISVPEIKMFKVELPDGSYVWLNSGSRLSYPSKFEENSRVVTLDGEGYFEIAKDASKPFIVNGGGMSVRVTGTKFNFKAYSDDKRLSATLVEGKVSVGYQDASGHEQVYKMKQGEQSNLNTKDMKLEVKEVNTSLYTGWLEGLYFFDSQKLEDIMSDLERWYGVEVTFKDDALREKILSGKLYREDSAEKMLESFEKLMPGHFKRDGKTVTVY